MTLVLYIRASLWSGEMNVEDLDFSKELGDLAWLATELEDFVLVREEGMLSSAFTELECKKLR